MKKTTHLYYIYIITNKKNGTLYIGVTNNLMRRVFEHKNELHDGFSKRYHLHNLVYFESFGNIQEALAREKRMKKWKRQWKINLIESNNKNWDDLALDWDD